MFVLAISAISFSCGKNKSGVVVPEFDGERAMSYIEKQVEFGCQPVFRLQVADQQRQIRQGTQDQRNIRLIVIRDPLPIENMDQVLEELRIGVGQFFHWFCAALPEKSVPVLATGQLA